MADINFDNVVTMLEQLPERVTKPARQVANIIKSIKWKSVSFIINTEPEPSHRPRLCGFRVYVPGAAKHQRFFDKEVLPKLKGLFISTPCIVDIDVYCKTPSSFTKIQQLLAEQKLIRPWGNVGDVDNFCKTVLDAMCTNEKRNMRGILPDDCIVIESRTRKFYSQSPRYEVHIKYMDDISDDLKKLIRFKF